MPIFVFLKSSLALVIKIDKRPRVDLRLRTNEGRVCQDSGRRIVSRRSSLAEPVVLAGGHRDCKGSLLAHLRGMSNAFSFLSLLVSLLPFYLTHLNSVLLFKG